MSVDNIEYKVINDVITILGESWTKDLVVVEYEI